MAYRNMWEIEVSHDQLGKYRHIRGSDRYVVEQKAIYQKMQWDKQWEKECQRKAEEERRCKVIQQKALEKEIAVKEKQKIKCENEADKAKAKEEALKNRQERKQQGEKRDFEAKGKIESLRNLLHYALSVNDVVDWEQFKDKKSYGVLPPSLKLPPFPKPTDLPVEPSSEKIPSKPELKIKPEMPDRQAPLYQPTFGIFDNIFASKKQAKIAECNVRYESHCASWAEECNETDIANENMLLAWEKDKKRIEDENSRRHSSWAIEVKKIKNGNISKEEWWEKNCAQARLAHGDAMAAWKNRAEVFYEKQKETNAAIDLDKERYLSGDGSAVADYCDTVLTNSNYPDFINKDWEIEYRQSAKTVIVSYDLPAPDRIPTIKEIQYVQSRDDYKELYLSEKERESLYDSVLYQIALRTIHELFEADVASALEAVVFNGVVTAVDKTSGHSVAACVLSVMAKKDLFMQINLASIEPKACFKSLRGVAASRLYGLSPIPPVMNISKDDRRFVSAYGVAGSIGEETNLATMNWEDFEHLIREVFEFEFACGGGDVKVTQASRDGGVDAVAFDPDPIKGGKIVIQAKRYTNTVSVSSVRDLYGTVMNEGATKGILVTTADYGPDAYEFAKGKPLTLLNGSNLLYLLEKHGHKARINLEEAKTAQKNI